MSKTQHEPTPRSPSKCHIYLRCYPLKTQSTPYCSVSWPDSEDEPHSPTSKRRRGLDSQAVFGPIRDFVCACGKYNANLRPMERLMICELCGVEVISAHYRLSRWDAIALPTAVPHPIFPDQELHWVPVPPPNQRPSTGKPDDLNIKLTAIIRQALEGVADEQQILDAFGLDAQFGDNPIFGVLQFFPSSSNTILESFAHFVPLVCDIQPKTSVAALLRGETHIRCTFDDKTCNMAGYSEKPQLVPLKDFIHHKLEDIKHNGGNLEGYQIPRPLRDLTNALWYFGVGVEVVESDPERFSSMTKAEAEAYLDFIFGKQSDTPST